VQLFSHLFRRFIGLLLIVYGAATLSFAAAYLAPGDPADAAFARSTAPPSVIEQRRQDLGLDRPVLVQYRDYISNLLTGSLGTSWQVGIPVNELLKNQFRPTANLAAASMLVALLIGGLLGLFPLYVESTLASVIRAFNSLLLSFPVMFSGVLLIWFFAVQLGWLPATGQGQLSSIILPALTVGLSAAGSIALSLDAGLASTLQQPFVLAAYARGLNKNQVILKHALPVGILPTLNLIALQVGFLLSGTVVTESLFARQGLGRLLLNAVLEKDLPVIQGVIVLSALVYGVLALLTDLLQAVIDPRVRAL